MRARTCTERVVGEEPTQRPEKNGLISFSVALSCMGASARPEGSPVSFRALWKYVRTKDGRIKLVSRYC